MASQSRYCGRNFFFGTAVYCNASKIFFQTTNGRHDCWLDAWYFVRGISFPCLGIQNRSEQITEMVWACIYSSVASHWNFFL